MHSWVHKKTSMLFWATGGPPAQNQAGHPRKECSSMLIPRISSCNTTGDRFCFLSSI